VAPDPEDEIEVELDDPDLEAASDEAEPEAPLVDAAGLGVDLPEADVLDQRREVPLDEEDDQR
jgi:hypothetical protein